MKKLSVLLIILFSVQSFAGAGSSGGGDAIICSKGIFRVQKKVFLADLYSIHRSGVIENFLKVHEEALLINTYSFLNKEHNGLGDVVEERLNKLNFKMVKYLEELDDDNIGEINKLPGFYCNKKQLAIQNLNNYEVRVSEKLFLLMSHVDQAFLKIHEALISLRNNPGEVTTEIRQFVENILRSDLYAKYLVSTLSELSSYEMSLSEKRELTEKIVIKSLRKFNNRIDPSIDGVIKDFLIRYSSRIVGGDCFDLPEGGNICIPDIGGDVIDYQYETFSKKLLSNLSRSQIHLNSSKSIAKSIEKGEIVTIEDLVDYIVERALFPYIENE